MSGRVQKSTKASQRFLLTRIIDQEGYEVIMPYSYCFNNHKIYRVSEKSSRCSKCIRYGHSCDGSNVASFCELYVPFLPGVFTNIFPSIPELRGLIET
ncbi:hypothetical protein BGZ61DRAFT_377031 [Ilyonectria robusta]|uniref:uncharacterized protein n=1 Tax=Ilyonectria robusta TaxID=1079257 RepID=UPI001E8DC723|nr:uncharacterized protein BGZ61DRAFT_377031 [Ilyonectria robusta]KAH8645951.1 hypothetical protein BGZ61DRAFT_377031 [Ilyonectria robusta]